MESLLRISLVILAFACVVQAEESAPNFVIILTDDQDVVLNGLVCIVSYLGISQDFTMTFYN